MPEVRSTPRLGEEIVGRLRGWERTKEVVRLHNVHELPEKDLPIEAAILRVAVGYDRHQRQFHPDRFMDLDPDGDASMTMLQARRLCGSLCENNASATTYELQQSASETDVIEQFNSFVLRRLRNQQTMK